MPRKRSAVTTLVLALLTAACATTAPDGTTTREPILTPIPGVTTTERLLAVSTCLSGLRAAGMSVAAIEAAADETLPGDKARPSLLVADQVIQEAKAKGVATSTISACGAMLSNAAKARAIRAAGPSKP